jgi:hypothetical protein
MNLFHLIQVLNAVGASIAEECQTIVRAPIATLLVAVIVSASTWTLAWSFFRRQLTSAHNLIETLESGVRARDEEECRRSADPVEWFRLEAQKEISRIRRNPVHPYNKGKKFGVPLMNRLQLIAHIHEYGEKVRKDRICDVKEEVS